MSEGDWRIYSWNQQPPTACSMFIEGELDDTRQEFT